MITVGSGQWAVKAGSAGILPAMSADRRERSEYGATVRRALPASLQARCLRSQPFAYCLLLFRASIFAL